MEAKDKHRHEEVNIPTFFDGMKLTAVSTNEGDDLKDTQSRSIDIIIETTNDDF